MGLQRSIGETPSWTVADFSSVKLNLLGGQRLTWLVMCFSHRGAVGSHKAGFWLL